MKDYFVGLWRDRFILSSLVRTDLNLKYKKSILGVAWSILTPLGLVVIIGIVYSIIFNMKMEDFIPGLFAGLNPWIFLSASADGGTMAFIGAEGYLKQTATNAQIFPIRNVLVNFINLLYSVIAFFIIYIFLKPDMFNFGMLMAIVGLIINLLFAIALSNVSAVINLKIRDFQPFQSLIYQGLFYATPIIFPAKILKEKGFEYLYRINPFYYMIEVIKTPLLGEKLPSMDIYLIAIVISVVWFLFSIFLVMKEKKYIAFRL